MSQDFEKMMIELRVDYVASFPNKIKEIQSHHQTQDLERLRDDFHKLKGTGKTYGIPEISDFGLVFEKLCLKKHPSAEFVPFACELLQLIYQHRVELRPYDVEQNTEFLKWKKLAL
jgi:HPt (histidine-containing phosphotransfer) domain-containing protein